jgi:hypothetical protein
MLSRRSSIIAALSLLVSVLCAVAWVRSFGSMDGVFHVSGRGGIFALYTNDGVIYAMLTPDYVSTRTPGWHRPNRSMSLNVSDRFSSYSFLGFQLRLSDPRMHLRFIGIPLWFPILLGFIPTSIWYVRRENRRRIAKGLCVSCCRDLAGCTGACPDCGKPIPSKTIATTV